MGDAVKFTPAQIALLRAVADGKVDRLASTGYYADLGGRIPRKVTALVQPLYEAGLINLFGVAMKRGKPMPPEEQFADYHVVTLTDAGRRALADAASSGPKTRKPRSVNRPLDA